ncbi:hypothetical protein PIROE2DRAFT_64921 [Piromyces sp. E2]|nr:hypothetical protein PIROE2DRAFT_64921 [Piromyces sp. E2]|eukprot:OUM57580.1 hypothetical protein PIROE2DRAFT_64921 [Piromyces sp. E2]
MSDKEIYNYVESRDCCIMMGVQITDTVSGIFSSKRFLKNDDNIRLTMTDGVQINNHSYANVNMLQILNLILSNEVFQEDLNAIYTNRHAYRHSSYTENTQKILHSVSSNNEHRHNHDDSSSSEENENVKEIKEKDHKKDISSDNQDITFTKGKVWKTNLPSSFLKKILNFEPSAHRPIQNDTVYRIINRWINSNTTIVCDVGDPSFGTYDLFMPKGSIYINPAIYLSLGFGVPGALGMTCQEISAIARYHYHPIIIVLNNNGYTTEKGLDEGIKKANTIHSWNYEKLIELIGTGRYIGNIRTEKDLDLALCHCFDMTSAMAIVTTTTGYNHQSHNDYPIYNNESQEKDWQQKNLFHQHQKTGERGVGEKIINDIDKENVIQQENDETIPLTSGIIDKVYSKEKKVLLIIQSIGKHL